MSYTYENGCMMVTTEIHGGFKRFNTRNAQYRHSVDGFIEQWDFVSYAYPVMCVYHWIDIDEWEIVVVDNVLDCSRTTTRQIGDFLKFTGCPMTIAHIRKTLALNVVQMHFDYEHSVSVCDDVNSRFDIRF